MFSMNYTLADTLDGTLDSVLLSSQIAADPLITIEVVGVNQEGSAFSVLFVSQPSTAEQHQCTAVVSAHSGLASFQDGLVDQIKLHRDQSRLENDVTAEYPAASGNQFSCSISSQDNWSKLSTLDDRQLVSYPFVVTTVDERGSYAVTGSSDLTNIIGTVSSAVFIERTLAQTYITAVLAAPDEASAQAAAQPYLDL